MNFLQLCNRVRQDCGISGSDLTTVTSQTGEFLRITNWVNEAWMDVQAMRTDWMWMRKSITFPTVAHQTTYTPTQIGLTDFSEWDRDTFRNYANPAVTVTIASPGVFTLQANLLTAGDTVIFYTTGALPTGLTAGLTYYVINVTTDTFQVSATLSGAAINTTGSQSGIHTMTSSNVTTFAGFKSEIPMAHMEYDQWRDSYLVGALRTIATRPNQVSITPNKSIALGPIADAGYTVVGDYFSVPTEMSASTDIPGLPTQFHLLIVYKAMILYGLYEAAGEVVERGREGEKSWARRVLASQKTEIRVGPSLS